MEGIRDMKKSCFGFIVVIVSIIAALSGCQEEQPSTTLSDDKIQLQSDIFAFAYKNLEIAYNKSGTIDGVTVEWRFSSIVDRIVSAEIYVEFYDRDHTLLYTGFKELLNVPPGYTEQALTPSNTVLYDGSRATQFDHVVIRTEEI